MPTDAKCGLLVGFVVVLAVAVLFFRTDSRPAETKSRAPAAAVHPPESPVENRPPGRGAPG